jgi:hypothetical protein
MVTFSSHCAVSGAAPVVNFSLSSSCIETGRFTFEAGGGNMDNKAVIGITIGCVN